EMQDPPSPVHLALQSHQLGISTWVRSTPGIDNAISATMLARYSAMGSCMSVLYAGSSKSTGPGTRPQSDHLRRFKLSAAMSGIPSASLDGLRGRQRGW